MGLPFPLSLNTGGGGPTSSKGADSIAAGVNTPFNFDDSGWSVVMHGNGNTQKPSGNTGANATSQSPAQGAAQSLMRNPNLPLYLGGAVVLILLLRR